MKPIKLIVNTNSQKYPILIGSNLMPKMSVILKDNSIEFKKCLMVIDKNVPKKMILKLKKSLKTKDIYTFLIKANEKNKSLSTIKNILEILLNKNFSRSDCLIALGGGITGDVAGFASSLFKRGLKFINIPTTLLSQVDSSIGGKTGINSKYGKNLIGSFYQPKLVLSDIIFLNTLPEREIICGYAEVLKHALISNKKFFLFLSKNISNILELKSPYIEQAIFESCKIKKVIVEKDEKEKNLRKILNFGHTFAHGYEAALSFSRKLNHGEAVLLGMCSALRFSYENKLLKKNEYRLILKHLNNPQINLRLKNYFSTKNLNKILTFMLKDKKNNSKKINLILLKKIGYPIISKEYTENYIKSYLKKELVY